MENESLKIQFLENVYETLTVLGKNREKEPSVFLVRNRQSGIIAVKKYIDKALLPVYEKLTDINEIHLEKIYDLAQDEEKGIVFTEYIAGNTLAEILEQKGVFTEKEACKWIEELLLALSKVHQTGIVHRDITPNNIMISHEGVLKLIDFGIARQKKENQFQDTTILGTVGYAAPEQFGFIQTDERTDIYAVGVLWNMMLTNSFPAERLYPNSPVREMIQRCTEIDSRKRFQSADEMLKRLSKEGKLSADFHAKEDTSQFYKSKWLPGFRTGVVWKNVVATIGYICMILYSFMSIYECSKRSDACALEIIAILMYVWMSNLLAANIAQWDRRWIFRKLPKQVMMVFRVTIWICLFYIGVLLENYVRYELLGIVKK